jgi:hypothetical protein
MQMRPIALAILAATLVTAPARAVNDAGARAFVAWLYSHYPTAEHRPAFEPFGPDMARVFHPSLIALIKQDQRLTNGEVGALDSDPLCDCQDDGGLTFKVASVRSAGRARASAVVVRAYPGDKEIEDITLDLVQTQGQWRVYDVHSLDTPSVRALLIHSNQGRPAH